jgi:hypothetical protein
MNLTRILPVLGLSVLFFITSGESLFAQDWILSKLIEKPAEGIYLKGNPEIIDCPYGKAVRFNGESDGIFLHQMPLAGVEQFTIEVVFKPESGGNFEQRFFHCGEIRGDRVLLELRATQNDWYFDAFINSGEQKMTLIDPAMLHPLDRWYHVAYVVDRGKLTTYIDGEKELEGKIDLSPLRTGNLSLGVRQNEQSWFKGAIYQIRISPVALDVNDFIKNEPSPNQRD